MNYSFVSYKGFLMKVIFFVYICIKWEMDVDNFCVCMYNVIWLVG